ncbi:MAG: universal stress protein [Thermoleophilia bacterium]|nr:universal stress protein [Thermoleophilia bacterium]
MYKKMVVLLDGSELAEVVFEYAQELSGRMHLDVELLHVCRPQEAEQAPMRRAYMEHMATVLCEKAEEIRRKYAKETLEECVYARGNVVVGNPAQEILKYVDENDIDLILMSTRGSSGVGDWDIGSIANKVIHASKIPVWLVPVELREEIIDDTMPRKDLVVPLSGSKMSEAAVSHAAQIVRQRGKETPSELVLLHVYDPGIVVTRAALDDADKRRAEMKAYLEGVAKPLRDEGLVVRTEVLTGEPAEAVITYLKVNPAQLLAMATRGHRSLSRVIFGSVTENVIHLVKKTPLLLVSAGD